MTTHSKYSNGEAGKAFWDQRGERKSNTKTSVGKWEGLHGQTVLALGVGSSLLAPAGFFLSPQLNSASAG